eukprot:3349460-Pleurochrysis_carterae.AAC.1
MTMREPARIEACADLAKKQRYFSLKREQASQRQLKKLVTEYVKAMAAYVKGRATRTIKAARAQLARIGLAADRHTYLREQIEMRVLGLGLAEHAMSWSKGGRQRCLE